METDPRDHYAGWMTTWDDALGDALGVALKAVIRGVHSKEVVWACDHRHRHRGSAKACAQAEMDRRQAVGS